MAAMVAALLLLSMVVPLMVMAETGADFQAALKTAQAALLILFLIPAHQSP